MWINEANICIEGLTNRTCQIQERCHFCRQNLLSEEKIKILESLLIKEHNFRQKQRLMPAAASTSFPVLGR
jgi:hypothetical protein